MRTPEQILRDSRTIAVLGARDKPDKAGCYVGAYLVEVGYDVIPVSPRLAGSTLWGQPVVADLGGIDRPVDIVDVFRRGDALPAHLDEILALNPKVAWFQLGVRNDAVARALSDAGIQVVQDRCTLADHRSYRIGPIR